MYNIMCYGVTRYTTTKSWSSVAHLLWLSNTILLLLYLVDSSRLSVSRLNHFFFFILQTIYNCSHIRAAAGRDVRFSFFSLPVSLSPNTEQRTVSTNRLARQWMSRECATGADLVVDDLYGKPSDRVVSLFANVQLITANQTKTTARV